MKLTFGKYKGMNTEDLARAGDEARGYLVWCVENLRSPKWRQECERALSLKAEQDVELTARATTRANPDIGITEARYLAREEVAQERELAKMFDAVEAKETEIARKWSGIIGQPEAKLRAIGKRYEFSEWDRLPASRFSNRQAFEGFGKFMAEWEARYD